jgi:hypothetical protein
MKFSNLIVAAAAAVVLVTGCAQQRGPANEALDKIEASLKEIKDDAAKYAPDGLKGVEAQFDRLKASYEAKEYDNVLAGTPALSKAVDSLKAAISSGKQHAQAAYTAAKTEWDSLNDEVPKTIESIQARVDELQAKKRLPFGINKDEFEGAKGAFESLKAEWAAATAEAKKGDPVEATTKGKTAKGMAESIKDQLKIKTA